MIPNSNRMEGCAKIQTNRGITGNVDTTNTNAPKGPMPRPCPWRSVCKTIRSSVIVKEVKTNVRWRDELRHQPGPMDHPTQEDRGPSNLKRGRQGHRHTVSIAGCHTGRCRDYNPCSRQSPVVRGGDGTSYQPQAQQTSKAGRLKQTSR